MERGVGTGSTAHSCPAGGGRDEEGFGECGSVAIAAGAAGKSVLKERKPETPRDV